MTRLTTRRWLLVLAGAAVAAAWMVTSCVTGSPRRRETAAPALTSSEWQQLRQLIVRDLAAPESSRLGNGMPDRFRLIDRCRLACGWTDPAFRQPLLRCLREHDLRPYAVACLLRYDDPELAAAIAPWRDERVVHHYTGDIVAETTITEMCDTYASLRELPDWVDAADLPAQAAKAEAADVADRRDGFLALLRVGILADAHVWRLAPAAIDAAARDHSDYEYTLAHLIIGRERAIPFLRQVADSHPTERERLRLLELRWSVGDDTVAAAARARLASLIDRFADSEDPAYETALGPLCRLCHRPDTRWRDLYLRLLHARSTSMAQIGWSVYLKLDEPPDRSLIAAPWRSALCRHGASDVFDAIADTARAGATHRLEWADWLVVQRAAISLDDWCDGPAWIDAMAAVAGVDFGFNGRCFPSGLNRGAVATASTAALAWYTSLHR